MKKKPKTALEDAIMNRKKYVWQMMKMDDEKLSRNIECFREQLEMAHKQNNREVFELLSEYIEQTSIARIMKRFAGKNGTTIH